MKRIALALVLCVAACNTSKKDDAANQASDKKPAATSTAADHEATAKWGAATAEVKRLEKELELNEVALTVYQNAQNGKGPPATEAVLAEAKVKLPELEKERTELKAALEAATAEQAKYKAGADAARTRGLNISDECKANPLAKGCS